MDINKSKREKRLRRQKRVRSKVLGTALKPRLSVFCSNKHTFAQLIDDEKEKTILALGDEKVKGKTKTEKAHNLGKELALMAKAKKIKKAIFDRGGYKYHGRVKAVAEGARTTLSF